MKIKFCCKEMRNAFEAGDMRYSALKKFYCVEIGADSVAGSTLYTIDYCPFCGANMEIEEKCPVEK